MTENFILSGYRCPGYTFAQCLVSAFRPTNETGNFWTHFLAIFVFAFHFLEQFWGEGQRVPGGLLDPFYYPLWNYFLGVCGLLVASSMAHLFNSMSLVIREICFYIDYGTISAYTCLIALFCTLACCSTRHQWPRYRYLIRTLVFLLPFGVVSIPVFHKLWQAGGGQGTSHFFLRHCFWLLASGIFNVGKIPERFSPGKFDIWGHSHQWFHCCTLMSILDELYMIQGEMQELGAGLPLLPRAPTFLSTFGVMLLLLLAGIVGWFGVRAHASHQRSKGTKMH
ncbi:membrane progesterone receptor epsilon-like [Rhineura floridana]|uniref:membrane progesterone receptor epsilon-like n=1 Tax=Rhineura floridana TaxID=261503 RepID=UPI002AC80A28|nr:membrane progesterone receptor epsilon-like [Rhineura floridana]